MIDSYPLVHVITLLYIVSLYWYWSCDYLYIYAGSFYFFGSIRDKLNDAVWDKLEHTSTDIIIW